MPTPPRKRPAPPRAAGGKSADGAGTAAGPGTPPAGPPYGATPVPRADPRRDYLAGGAVMGWGGYGRGYGGSGLGNGLQVLPHRTGALGWEFTPAVIEQMCKDPAVASAINQIKHAAIGQGITLAPAVEPDPDDPADDADAERAKACLEFCQRALGRLTARGNDLADACSSLLDGMATGCALAEVTYEVAGDGPDKGKLVLASVLPKPPEAWAQVVDQAGRRVGILSYSWLLGQGAGPTPAVAVPATTPDAAPTAAATAATLGGYAYLPLAKFFIFEWASRYGDPRGRSILEPAQGAWNQKQLDTYQFSRTMDLHAKPKFYAEIGEDAPQTVTVADASGHQISMPIGDAVNAGLYNLNNECDYASFPAGVKVSILQAQAAGDIFLGALRYRNTEIAMAILGNARASQEAANSSKADAEAAQDTAVLPANRAAKLLGHGVRGLLRDLVAANDGLEFADKFTPHPAVGGSPHQDEASKLTAAAACGYKYDDSQMPRLDQKYNQPVRRPRSPEQIAQDQENQLMQKGLHPDQLAAKAKGAIADTPANNEEGPPDGQGDGAGKPGDAAGKVKPGDDVAAADGKPVAGRAVPGGKAAARTKGAA